MSPFNHIAKWRSFAEVFVYRAKGKGLLWIAAKTAQKALMFMGWFLLLPLSAVGHFVGFRRITVFTDRIGHLAAELDCFEKERQLGRLPARRFWFVLAPRDRVANLHLLNYWKPHVHVISHPLSCTLLKILTWKGFMVHDIGHYILSFVKSARYYEVNIAWGVRPPVLSLTVEDCSRKQILLSELGLPADAWYVCFHNREDGFSPQDEIIHSHRNSSIDHLISAMQFVTSQGGWCIRMGDPTMKHLPPIPGVVDYAHHPLRSEQADVLLCAGCRYFVGSSSGLFIVASIFGVPCALANMVPVSTLGYSPSDIAIPKLLCRLPGNDAMSFPPVFELPLANYRLSSQYKQAGVMPIENTSEEILGLVREMHGVVDGTWSYDELDEILQNQFKSLLRPSHYGYGAGGRIGALFLRQHRVLFDMPTSSGLLA